MEFSTRRAAERVALIRTFETSETQAHTDPLTGLLNRRSLENRVRELQSDGIPYALAYGDLDFFKTLNDVHGHEAGDQALRLFSRVMRDSVRPVDLVSRYGGEEFVIVLPDCTPDTATSVLERVRERLALALTSGRVPPSRSASASSSSATPTRSKKSWPSPTKPSSPPKPPAATASSSPTHRQPGPPVTPHRGGTAVGRPDPDRGGHTDVGDR